MGFAACTCMQSTQQLTVRFLLGLAHSWPLLLAGILGISATAGAKALSHTVSFALILAIVSNLAQYTYWRSTSRTGSTWRRLGPTIVLLLAIPLTAADPLRHVLQDSGVWFGPSSSMYRPGCSPVSGLHGFWCLSVTGWTFQLCTWIGFALMVTGIVWQADLIPKLRAAWRDIKRARAHGRQRQQVGAGAV